MITGLTSGSGGNRSRSGKGRNGNGGGGGRLHRRGFCLLAVVSILVCVSYSYLSLAKSALCEGGCDVAALSKSLKSLSAASARAGGAAMSALPGSSSNTEKVRCYP